MIEQNSILNKWWYRALKVLYIFAWLISIVFVFFIAYSAGPRKVQSYSMVNVTCIQEGTSFDYSPTDSFFTSIDDIDWTNADEAHAKESCDYGLYIKDYTKSASVGRNFTVDLKYTTYGSWKDAFITLGIGLLTVFAVIEVIKTAVLYILGVSIWRGMFLYLLLFLASMHSGGKEE